MAYKVARPKYFCHRCGGELVAKEVYAEYDNKTGKRYAKLKWYCPSRRWYQVHTHFKSYDMYEAHD